jgi:hypothetical protein
MLSNYFPIKFANVELIRNEPLWKQIIGLYIYEWDEQAPNGATVYILGFAFNFLLGRWEYK